MKHATCLLILAGGLGACGTSDSVDAANSKAAQKNNQAASAAAQPTKSDAPVARTPVAPEQTRPPATPVLPKEVDPKDVDTRSTDPVGTDATIVDGHKKSDAGQSDSLTQPGIPKAVPGSTGPDGAAAKPAAKDPLALGAMDTEFITKAALGGLFEVQSSELAVSQATTQFVRDFAQMMVLDHGDANRELETLARGKGAVVPKELDEEHESRLATLRDQKGVDFDRQYRDMQTTAHKDAIALFERAASTCEDPELKAFAAKLLPTLREHQQKLNEMPPTQG
jgi:putative membrane protein